MCCMKRDVLKEASVAYIDQTSIISSTYTVKVVSDVQPLLRALSCVCVCVQEFDVTKVAVSELEFVESFQLTIDHNTLCHVRPYKYHIHVQYVIVGTCIAGTCGVL